MKILCQLPLKLDLSNPAFKPFLDLFDKEAQVIKKSDTELVVNPAQGLSDFEGQLLLGLRFLNERDIFKSLLDGVKRDIDGVILLCYLDPALWAARQMLEIPVTGLAESAMYFASLVGRKFAIIAGDERYVAQIQETIKAYDMRAKGIENNPVRSIEMSEVASLGCFAQGDLSPLVEKVRKVGQGCIKDGAEVLIIGCGITSVLLTVGAGLKEIDGVPIVDPVVSSIKTIELLVDIKKSGIPIKSKRGLFWTKETS